MLAVMDAKQIEAIERATLAAVPPQAQQELQGWLLGLDGGTVGRCHSAVPLRHSAPPQGLRDKVEACYREQGLRTVWRLPALDAFAPLQAELRTHGYVAAKPTLVQVGSVQAMAALPRAHSAGVATTPDEGWAQVFLGEGFDPVDGASRLAILRRATHSAFASIRIGERVAAVGSACFAQGWCGIHGMRTAPAWRGQGLAAAILHTLAREAAARGVTRAFLQVEQDNAPAQALYRRAGFEPAWRYEYWSAPA